MTLAPEDMDYGDGDVCVGNDGANERVARLAGDDSAVARRALSWRQG